MELGARREHKSAWDIAAFYAEAFRKDWRRAQRPAAGRLVQGHRPYPGDARAGAALEERGSLRIADGIYFDTSKFPPTARCPARLEGLKPARAWPTATRRPPGQEEPPRLPSGKFSPPGEKRQMEWELALGPRVPGWHIECSP